MTFNINFKINIIRSLVIVSIFCIQSVMALPIQSPLTTTEILTGRTEMSIKDPTGDRHLEGYIWYPTQDLNTAEWAHGNSEAVWEPIKVHPDSAPLDGHFPLVVLSHGLFGTAHNQAWLAESLVKHGFIVAAIHHPGTSHFFRDPIHRKKLWQRAEDISRVIDYVTTEYKFANLINQDQIFMAGHSLGGFTAMLLAGARYDSDVFQQFCIQDPNELVCSLFSTWNIAQTESDRISMEQDWSDNRIRAFAIFDLGGTQSLSRESLAAIEQPLLIFGAPVGEMKLNLDIESRYLVDHLSPETTIYIEPERLGHFDFLAVCTEQALELLREVEPDDLYVCENGREPRQQIHQFITEHLLVFFSNQTDESHSMKD